MNEGGTPPHASGSNWTVSPGSKDSTSPAGQVIVLARKSILKSPLVKRPGRCAQRPHGLANTVPPRGEHVIDDGAVDVGAIDMKLDEPKPLALDVLDDGHGALLLGPIGGRHGASDDRREVQVAGDVLLVAIEALRAALASVPHLAVADRDTSVGSDAFTDASPAFRAVFQVLCAHLARSRRCTGAAART